MASDRRYGPAPKQPQDAASLLDMIDGPITIVGEAELAELRRKAAAWDRLYTLVQELEGQPEFTGLYHVLRQRMDYEISR